MKRRDFLRLAVIGGASAFAMPLAASDLNSTPVTRQVRRVKPFELDELSIARLQDLVDSHKASALSLTKRYLAHIEAIDRRGPRLNAVIELNPDALAIASELDMERLAKGRQRPLHVITVLIQDNVGTHAPLTTTPGSLGPNGSVRP